MQKCTSKMNTGSLKFITLYYFLCDHTAVLRWGQRTTCRCRSWFSPSSSWVPGTKPGVVSGLAVDAFTHCEPSRWPRRLALKMHVSVSFLLLQQNAETVYMIQLLFSSQSKQYDVSFGVSCDDLVVGVHWVVTWWNRKLESAVGQPSFL